MQVYWNVSWVVYRFTTDATWLHAVVSQLWILVQLRIRCWFDLWGWVNGGRHAWLVTGHHQNLPDTLGWPGADELSSQIDGVVDSFLSSRHMAVVASFVCTVQYCYYVILAFLYCNYDLLLLSFEYIYIYTHIHMSLLFVNIELWSCEVIWMFEKGLSGKLYFIYILLFCWWL